MTRILLLSDTHGNIDIINTLVEKTKGAFINAFNASLHAKSLD